MPRKKSERQEDNLEKLVKEYYSLDTQIKELSDRKDPLNKSIKLVMKNRGITKFKAGDLTAVYTTQTRPKYYDEPTVKKLKSLGLQQAIKEVVDVEAVRDLIKTGQITEDLLVDFLEIKEIEVLTVKKE